MSKWSVITPVARTNYVKNPVAGATGNYAALNSASVSRNTNSNFILYGGWSMRVNATAVNRGVAYTLQALVDVSHYVTVRIKTITTLVWHWSLDDTTYTAPVYLRTEKGSWQVYGLEFPRDQANGSTTLYIRRSGGGIQAWYLGHVQVERLEPQTIFTADETTPIFGDLPGCTWLGAPHASASVRSGQSRQGGYVVDLDDYGWICNEDDGIGVPGLDVQMQDYVMIPGALYRGTRPLQRSFVLTGTFHGDGLADLHANRSAMINALRPDRVVGPSEIVLRYTGANAENPLELRAALTREAGAQAYSNHQRVALSFVAADPFFYELGETAMHLETGQLIGEDFTLVAQVDGEWAGLMGGGEVSSIAIGPDKRVYAAGLFTVAGGAPASYIAVWDGSAWAALDAGVANLFGLAFAPNGDLYAVGNFTVGGGAAADCIAVWDGSAWAAVGTGLNGPANDVAIGQDGNVYVTGDFTAAGGGAAALAAVWDGSAWAALGAGLGGVGATGQAVAVAADGRVYFGGLFSTAGGAAASNIAVWDGSAWSALGAGVNGTVMDIFVDRDGQVYATGYFTTAGGVAANRVARWNGVQWFPLGSGLDNIGRAFSQDPDGRIWVGGHFATAGGLALESGLAIWNRSTWAAPDVALGGGVPVTAVEITSGGDIYLGLSLPTSAAAGTGAETTVTNAGGARAYPTITISRAGGTLTKAIYIENTTTGKRLLLNYSLQDGETLTINLEPGRRSVISSYYGNVWSAVARSSDLTEFFLQPGDNAIRTLIAEAGTPTITAYMTWKTAYWSADE